MFRVIVDSTASDKMNAIPVGSHQKITEVTRGFLIPEKKTLQRGRPFQYDGCHIRMLDDEMEGDFVNVEAAGWNDSKVFVDKRGYAYESKIRTKVCNFSMPVPREHDWIRR